MLIEKFKRYYQALKLIYPEFLDTKNDPKYAEWKKKYKKNGIPYEKKNDQDYINWHNLYKNKLDKFQNLHDGEDCFIVGNGPSLNKMDLSRLNGYHVFGLNKIYLILEKQFIDFSYMVAVNPLVIEQSKEVFESMHIPIFLSYYGSLGIEKPHIYKIRTKGEFSFSFDFSHRISEGYTVTYVAIQLAYIMGFKRIFLIGVDHNFQQTGLPNSEQIMQADDPNHFHPDYFKGQQWHLADLEGNEISYRIAKKMFSRFGREIYDATVNGKLEIFEKKSFEDSLAIAKKKKAG